MKLRFPVQVPFIDFISLEKWRTLPVKFFFDKNCLFNGASGDRRTREHLRQRVQNLHAHRFFYFYDKIYSVDDWLTNPQTGFPYNIKKHWTEIADFSKEAGAIKFVWEKSRFTFLYDLVRYEQHFAQDQAEIAFGFIEHWIDENPVNRGPHWICSQEIMIRVMNWTFALQFYKDSSALTPRLFGKIINSIYQQVCHVEENLSFSRIAVRNNHVLTETLGLYLVGVLYPFFDKSYRWKKMGKRHFEEEITYQIYPDGTFLQFSMNYHRMVVQLLSWGIRLAHLNGEKWVDVFYERAKASLTFLLSCQDPVSGHLPNYGNDDGSLLFPLTNCHYRDYRPQLLALAKTLDFDLDYGEGPWLEESFWMGIHQNASIESNHKRPVHGTKSFNDGGYYVFQEDTALTFIRCGSYRHRPFQSDHMHLDIWANGENILRDAGSYQYNTDAADIRYFTGTASHNSVMLDDYDQMRKGERFIWLDWITKGDGKWTEEPDGVIFDGWFEGFKQLGKNIVHRRRVKKLRDKLGWIVEDWIENAPVKQTMRQIWHPCEGFFEKFTIEATLKNGQKIRPQKSDGWYAEAYGRKSRADQLVFETRERYIRTKISGI